jgi:hypothetical protein
MTEAKITIIETNGDQTVDELNHLKNTWLSYEGIVIEHLLKFDDSVQVVKVVHDPNAKNIPVGEVPPGRDITFIFNKGPIKNIRVDHAAVREKVKIKYQK